ncbi:group III truncated hemoglobin [Algoriphagus halophytocola]|uniref:Group III truncated hemoglobin n=1 Tax=Algoriphagus halophytocola TaxID=2991499 RepID=A0ABY6MP38_9BACT|nr:MULTISPECIES: group III truncated hemoglobin [unclassified Algoriphagus]UZD24157.1 group III truncated hemoglobin [Algoriphagus sp. TR-M5]WBL41528.1 group III truncated hemoglobin [Algoriphagus sp. TR-M9]
MDRVEIRSRKEVDFLVRRFYDQVRKNELLGPIFNGVVKDWDTHLVHLSDFWEMILLQTGPGAGKFNPVKVHRTVDAEVDNSIEQAHFGNWLELWFGTIDRYFEGEVAAYAKEHARRMAHMLFMRIWEARER